jgi:two-component system response regulator FixJ
VYLIDDDAATRRSLSSQLAGLGIEAWPFAGGAEFVGMIGHLRPSCVLLDMEMPHVSGLEVLAELVRQDVDWPVIAVSSRGELAVARRRDEARRAVDFLAKPLQIEPLEEALSLAFDSLERTMEASLARQQAQDRVSRLTPREVDIASPCCAAWRTRAPRTSSASPSVPSRCTGPTSSRS